MEIRTYKVKERLGDSKAYLEEWEQLRTEMMNYWDNTLDEIEERKTGIKKLQSTKFYKLFKSVYHGNSQRGYTAITNNISKNSYDQTLSFKKCDRYKGGKRTRRKRNNKRKTKRRV